MPTQPYADSPTRAVDVYRPQIRRSVPVLIHSHNASKPVVMKRALESHGFTVTRIRFTSPTEESFGAWLNDVRDNWEPDEEGSGGAR
jgi:hypothetical protein